MVEIEVLACSEEKEIASAQMTSGDDLANAESRQLLQYEYPSGCETAPTSILVST